MTDTALDTEELARLVGGRAIRRRRMSRRMLARLIGERSEADDDFDEDDEEISDEGGDKEKRIARLLIGSRLLRRARLRKLVLAHLLRERDEAEDDDEISDEDSAENGEGKDRQLARLLIASGVLRRRRSRRMILGHLMREHGEAEGGEDEDSDDEFAEGGEDRDKQMAKLLIATGMLRRRRTRRMILAHIARERREGEDED